MMNIFRSFIFRVGIPAAAAALYFALTGENDEAPNIEKDIPNKTPKIQDSALTPLPTPNVKTSPARIL